MNGLCTPLVHRQSPEAAERPFGRPEPTLLSQASTVLPLNPNFYSLHLSTVIATYEHQEDPSRNLSINKENQQ